MGATLNTHGPAAGNLRVSAVTAPGLESALVEARTAQRAWMEWPLKRRIALVRRVRHAVAEETESLVQALDPFDAARQDEALVSQIFPLAEACRFLEREAVSLLRPRGLGRRGRPMWLSGSDACLAREPHGVVLILGPSNYPLLLPAVQALQAVVAGNGVLWKPGRGGSRVAERFHRLLVDCGFPSGLVQVLSDSDETGRQAASLAVDKVVLTGSHETGRALLGSLAPRVIPATLELSGADAMVVCEDADLDLVVRAVAFGVRLNHSATCIAPRRLIVASSLESALLGRLSAEFARSQPALLPDAVSARLQKLVSEACADGARILAGGWDEHGGLHGPLVLGGARPGMALLDESFFAPILAVVAVDGDEAAAAAVNGCRFALGCSVFSRSTDRARSMAARVRVGVVTINDLIVPTADPRLPFGGRGRSGFGVTRGAEGLLEMTVPKVITARVGGGYRHFDPLAPADARLLRQALRLLHGRGIAARWNALREIFLQAVRRGRRSPGPDPKPRQHPSPQKL